MNEQILGHMRKNLNPNYITGLKDLISVLPEKINMIEIGCYAGESTKLFLDSGKVEHLFAIDPYIDNYDLTDEHATKFKMIDVLKNFTENIIQNHSNVTLIKDTSDRAIDYFKGLEGQFDFVYIDGNHQYEVVKMDILRYVRLVKKGGIIAGHDYHPAWDSVKKAVDEIFTKPDQIFNDDSWMVRI